MPTRPDKMKLILTNPNAAKSEKSETVVAEEIPNFEEHNEDHNEEQHDELLPDHHSGQQLSVTKVTFYKDKGCKGSIFFVVYSNNTENHCENCYDLCSRKFPNSNLDMHSKLGSVKVEGP